MQRAHEFHEVFDTQRVFRAMLDAFANPGRVVSVAEAASRLHAPHGAFLAVACTLLDNTTGFSVLGGGELSEWIPQFTFAREQGPEDAAFLFVLEKADPDALLSRVCLGTLEEPHLGATVIVCVEALAGCQKLRGPGVNGSIDAPLDAYGAAWLFARERLGAEYPCGADLVFMTDGGGLMAAPRLVRPVQL